MKGFVSCPRNCFDGCAFLYDMERGILIPRKDHTGVDGITCVKSRFLLDVARHPERIKKPLLRERDGSWREIPLDEALKIAARQIEKRDKVIRIDYSGNMMLLSRRFHHRLFHVLGAPHVRWDICAEAGSEGLHQSWGVGYGMDLPDMKGSDLVVIWGANVYETSVHAYTYAMKTKQGGGRVFVVDVLRSETASRFDLIRVNPGSDVALALLVFLLLKEKGYSVPMDIPYSREELVSISGVSLDKLNEFVDAFTSAKRPFIFMGYGFQRRMGGGMAVRLISLIPYITHRKPLFYYDRPPYGIDTDYVSGMHLSTGQVWSLTGMYRHIGDIENATIVVMNANPVNTLPRGDVIADALSRSSNFTIVHELFMTDTARHADLIIPSAASVEYEDVMITYGHKYVGLNEAVYEKPPHAITNMDFARSLARLLDLKQEELYEDDGSVITYVLKKAGVDIDLLRKQGYAPLPDIPIRKEPIFPTIDEVAPYVRPQEKMATTF